MDGLATISAACGWCERQFSLRNPGQLGAYRAGRSVYCSGKCLNAHERSKPGRHQKICPTCGRAFASRTKTKTFCSVACYTSSPACVARLRECNEAKQLAAYEADKARGTDLAVPVAPSIYLCLQCNGEFRRRPSVNRKFCTSTCYRLYMAARFDRFIANPEKLALPQCYDEFLTQDLLPCLFEGCQWRGKFLGAHVNFAHGVTAQQFKDLAGFNAGTGLVTPDLRRVFYENAIRRRDDGTLCLVPAVRGDTHPASARRSPRLEALEHSRKSSVVCRNIGEPKPALPCRTCGKEVPQAYFGKTLYCSTRCRSAYYGRHNAGELHCDYCGQEFSATRAQIRQKQSGGKACCSTICRNRMNATAKLVGKGGW